MVVSCHWLLIDVDGHLMLMWACDCYYIALDYSVVVYLETVWHFDTLIGELLQINTDHLANLFMAWCI